MSWEKSISAIVFGSGRRDNSSRIARRSVSVQDCRCLAFDADFQVSFSLPVNGTSTTSSGGMCH